MTTLVVVIASSVAYSIVFNLATCAAMSAVGARIEEVVFGFGPGPTWKAFGVTFRIGVVPFGGHVLPRGAVDDDPYDEEDAFRRLPPERRALVRGAPLLVLAAVAGAILGPSRATTSFVNAYTQIVSAFDLTPLFEAFLTYAERDPVRAMASVFVKMTAMNALPISGTAGGETLRELLRSVTGSSTPPNGALALLSMLVIFVGINGRALYGLVAALAS